MEKYTFMYEGEEVYIIAETKKDAQKMLDTDDIKHEYLKSESIEEVIKDSVER